MTPDAAAAIVATVLKVPTATAYAPTDPTYGVIVMTDPVWFGAELLEFVRIDGLTVHGYVSTVELRIAGYTYTSGEADGMLDARIIHIADRIRDAINAVIVAAA